MSDCSNNAMKPKEREKSCGTCKYVYFDIEKGHICHCPKSGFTHREISAFGTCPCWKEWKKSKEPPKTGYETEYDIQPFCESCKHNLGYLMQAKVSADVSASYVELERRCQQLEQVAKEMLTLIKGIEREYPLLLDPNRKPGGQLVYPMPSEKFACQFTELGVNLDD